MLDTDFKEFMDIWTAANDVYGSSQSDAAIALSFSVLRKYDLLDIKKSISAYLSDPENGRFAPKPANIIKQLNEKVHADGRLPADEAWALAVTSFDESQTVVMSEDIARALEMSAPIYHDGDKVGARMAFRASYERLIQEARDKGELNKWFASLGHNPQNRQLALDEAVKKGRLTSSHVKSLLPAPMTQEGEAIAGLLTGKVVHIESQNEKIIEHLQKLKDAINSPPTDKKEKSA